MTPYRSKLHPKRRRMSRKLAALPPPRPRTRPPPPPAWLNEARGELRRATVLFLEAADAARQLRLQMEASP